VKKSLRKYILKQVILYLITNSCLYSHTIEMEDRKQRDPLEGVSIFKPNTWKRVPHNLKSWRDAVHN
jgi:hypothetical protein